MLCSQYFHNTFTTSSKWQIVISGQKNNFSDMYIRTSNNCHIESVMRKCCGLSIFQKLSKQTN